MRNWELITRLISGSRSGDDGVPTAVATGADSARELAGADDGGGTSWVRRPDATGMSRDIVRGRAAGPDSEWVGCGLRPPRVPPGDGAISAGPASSGTVRTWLQRPHRTREPVGYFATSKRALQAGQEMILRAKCTSPRGRVRAVSPFPRKLVPLAEAAYVVATRVPVGT